ncbi:helix-turn-helix transcriptional regulator [Streptomyces sp. OR43]|uniref:helix-turn-helix transcriptional regulator n=1 Tax=Streptomyces sp. or43 TaxID=2478957 RepID=UPI0021C5B353|nr:response regulator transcription factor [Streptomyces sp. or43]
MAVDAGRDPISYAGIVGQLAQSTSVKIISFDREPGGPSLRVALVVAETVDEERLSVLRRIQRTTSAQSILVIGSITEQALLPSLAAGAVGVILREQATPDHLESVINVVANQGGHLPPTLLANLLTTVGRVQDTVPAQRGLAFAGLQEREIDVLRLVADGLETAEIATKLGWSERTIKNIIQGVTTRLQLRNRAHAVAYAMRKGHI